MAASAFATVADLAIHITILAFGVVSLAVALTFIVLVGLQFFFSDSLIFKNLTAITNGLMLTLCKSAVAGGNSALSTAYQTMHGMIDEPVRAYHEFAGGTDPGVPPEPSSKLTDNCTARYPGATEYATFSLGTLTPSQMPTDVFPFTSAYSPPADINLPTSA